MSAEKAQEPVYQQLAEQLRALLGQGPYTPGAKFLSEREVCRRFHTSRATANKALSNLMAEGVLEYRRGIGTFVRPEVLDYDLRSLVSFTDKAAAAGRTPRTEVLDFRRLTGGQDPDPARALQLDSAQELIYMQRLRLADEQAVILECRWCPSALCPGISRQDLAGSVYALWTERYGLEIAGADQLLRAVGLSRNQAQLLGVPDGSAALLSVSTGHLCDGRRLWHERTLYRADAYEFHNRLGELRSFGPAVGKLCPLPPAPIHRRKEPHA